MDRDAKAAELSARSAEVIAAARQAAGDKPDALWVAASAMLAASAYLLGDTREHRDELLMEAERAARQMLSSLEAEKPAR